MITPEQKEKIKILDKLLSGIDTDTLENILGEAKIVSVLKNQSPTDEGIIQSLTKEIQDQQFKIQNLEAQIYTMHADIKNIVDILTITYTAKASSISSLRNKYGVY